MLEMGERVLVLDDEASILDILGQHLENEGYACTLVESPLKALELLEKDSFPLLMTDLKMPEMNGIEVVRHARAADETVAIIVVTALLDVTNAIEAMRAGADDYVLKPFNLDDISVSVQRALEKRHLMAEHRKRWQELVSQVSEATEDLAKTGQELTITKEYLQHLIDSTVDAIYTVNVGEHIALVNRGTLRMLGRSEEDMLGTPISDLLVGGVEEAQYIRRVLTVDAPLQNFESELRHATGTKIPVSMSISLVHGATGKLDSTLSVCKDITEQKRLENELKEMTIRDNLTGLYNQRHFYDRLEAEIERSRRQKYTLSLLVIDVDKFKSYNDAHGHLEGDKVLQTVAEVIWECTREHVDIGCRYGGDEFTVILPECPEAQAFNIAERLRGMFEAKRFDLLTMSIGLVTYQEGQTLRQFMQFTDSMMYDAKRAGGNRVYKYDPAQNKSDSPTSDSPKS